MRCSNCNNGVPVDDTNCGNCGLPIEYAAHSKPPLAPSPSEAQVGDPAGFWIRLVAVVVDSVILLIIVGIFLSWTGISTDMSNFPNDLVTPSDIPGFVLQALYLTVGLAVWSTTVGKRAFGLYVLRPDGTKLGPGRAFVRNLAQYLSAVLLGAGFFMIGLRKDKRGLHDLICDTVVVRR